MAGSPNAELADLLNEMLSVQERLRKHGIAFGTGLPGPPAGQPEAAASSSYAVGGAPALGPTTHTTGLQNRADLFPTFWGEPVSAFHGRMGYSANMWLHHFEGLRPDNQPPWWVRKFPLNDSGGVALSDLVGDLESVQVLRFISGADPDLVLLQPVRPMLPLQPHSYLWILLLMLFRSRSRQWFGAAGGFAWTARRPAVAKATRSMTR